MVRIIAVCLVLMMALACQASAVTVTSVLDSFNSGWVNSSVGQVSTPDGSMSGVNTWQYYGHGSVTTRQETNIIPFPAQGESAIRFNIPSIAGTGMATAINANSSQYITKYDINALPIDYTQPIYLKADIYGHYGGSNPAGTVFKSNLQITSIARTEQTINWLTEPNDTWTTITTTLTVNDAAYFAATKGKIYLTTFFDNPTAYTGESYVIWDNLRMEYSSTVPEPGSMLALATGLLGLVGLVRRRK